MLGLLVYGLVDLVHHFSGHMRTKCTISETKDKSSNVFSALHSEDTNVQTNSFEYHFVLHSHPPPPKK